MVFSSLSKKFNWKIILLVIVTILNLLIYSNSFYNYIMQHPYLGRVYDIILLILWTCINKYLGIFYVLFLVFFLMPKSNSFIENFETSKDSEKDSKKKSENDEVAKINVVVDKKDSSDVSMDNTKSSSQINKAIEGFDLQSAEDTIKRGKQSNSIPIDKLVAQSTNEIVDPYEKGEFSESFTNL